MWARCQTVAAGIFFIASLSICGCQPTVTGSLSGSTTARNADGSEGTSRKIVATTGMVADLVSHVVGEHGQVISLMGTGADPHLFKPTRNDVRKLLDADVIFASGLTLEHRMEETLEQMHHAGKPVFAVTDGLDRERLLQPEGSAGIYDPHVWMDVSMWSECADYVAKSLSDIDPDHAAEYQANAVAYQSELKSLDEYVTRVIASVPADRRVLVTAHDAFSYFSRRYDIAVRSVQGVSTESEAGIQDVNLLVDFLVERKIPAVFVESSVNPKHLTAVQEGCRSRGFDVQIGGELFSDAMGAAGTYEGTYFGMIDANATRISRALGGNAPEKGCLDKLSP
ncbi:manganese transporter [bacterium]|nr:manganese transporter [bacterium]